jgi:hypothetical protein
MYAKIGARALLIVTSLLCGARAGRSCKIVPLFVRLFVHSFVYYFIYSFVRPSVLDGDVFWWKCGSLSSSRNALEFHISLLRHEAVCSQQDSLVATAAAAAAARMMINDVTHLTDRSFSGVSTTTNSKLYQTSCSPPSRIFIGCKY